jgi:uncharacterized protein YqgV (UPF0045/DUF77 family)
MPVVSAQVSVYPLRSQQVSVVVAETIEELRRSGLDTRPGSMSTVVVGADDDVFAALAAAFRSAAERGEVVMVVTVSNACPRSPGRLRRGVVALTLSGEERRCQSTSSRTGDPPSTRPLTSRRPR